MKAQIPVYDRETKNISIIMVDWDDDVRFLWLEGNYSCDCNRGKFCGIENAACGNERFIVPYVKLHTPIGFHILGDFDGDVETEVVDACMEILK